MLKVYQVVMSKSDIDAANRGEHVLKREFKRDIMFDATAINSSSIEHFTHVAEVDTDDMDEAFELMNLWNDQTRVRRMFERCSSMSVGDLIEHEDGRTFFVAGCGFTEINV